MEMTDDAEIARRDVPALSRVIGGDRRVLTAPLSQLALNISPFLLLPGALALGRREDRYV
jgi:hypothetical protein